MNIALDPSLHDPTSIGPAEEPEFVLMATLPEHDPAPPSAPALVDPRTTSLAPTTLTPADSVLSHITSAVADSLHAIDIRAHLAMLARTEPKTFRMWVEMVLPKQQRAGNQQATIVNVHSALPKSALDALPPGFDVQQN
jgi:hypothetical protein